MTFRTTRVAAFACVTVCLFALSASAEGPFDGSWRSSPTADCTSPGSDGTMLEIEDNVLLGVEGQCRMTRPVEVRDMDAILYDMVCEDDESAFSERALFLHAADGGLILLWNGYAFKYDACTPGTPIGTVTTSDDIGIPR